MGRFLPHDFRILEALAEAADVQDKRGAGHSLRVQHYATELATVLDLSAREIQGVHVAALLHDIGKLAVPTEILCKPGPLTAEERRTISIHPQVGADLASRVPFSYPVATLILAHHERWDGSGYPYGLAGRDIPIGARVIATADCFDALTSDRPYQSAVGVDAALAILEEQSGITLDPLIVQAFLEVIPDLLDRGQAGLDARPRVDYPFDSLSR